MALVPFTELKSTIQQAFEKAGMAPADAETCARVHAESTADGVNSHGINRVAKFVEFIDRGWIQLGAQPKQVRQLGSVEVYDGQRGPGVLNALWSTERAMEVASQHGIALLGLRNTNHWMRGGSYGWHAAERGFVMIAWTNTESCMPPWGGREVRLGNNPFVMAAPRAAGPVVLDMAMSQYAYGKLQVTRLQGKPLPFPGGFDNAGQLTDDPGLIEESRRILPMGMWKGSGFAIMLDLLAAILSEGSPTVAIDALELGSCVGCSQIFVVADPRQFGGEAAAAHIADAVVKYVHSSAADENGRAPEYPGEGALRRRTRQMRDGIEVDDGIWDDVRALAERPPASPTSNRAQSAPDLVNE